MDKPAKCVYISMRDVDPEFEEEYVAWLVGEHLPDLLAVPGVIRALRYVSQDGDSPKYMNIFELDNPEVLKSEAWVRATGTPRSRALRDHWHMKARNTFELVDAAEGKATPT